MALATRTPHPPWKDDVPAVSMSPARGRIHPLDKRLTASTSSIAAAAASWYIVTLLDRSHISLKRYIAPNAPDYILLSGPSTRYGTDEHHAYTRPLDFVVLVATNFSASNAI